MITIVLGFPIVRLITKWLEPRPVPPRELSTISGRLEKIEAAVAKVGDNPETVQKEIRALER